MDQIPPAPSNNQISQQAPPDNVPINQDIYTPSKTSLFVPILVTFFVTSILFVGGFFGYQYYQMKQKLTATSSLSPSIQPTTTPSPRVTDQPVITNSLNIAGSLQDFMNASCTGTNPRVLSEAKLPFIINTRALKVNIKQVYCSSVGDNSQPIEAGFITMRLDNNQDITISDNQSQELGHGGAPFIGMFGQKIYDQNTVQIGAWLQAGDGPQTLGDTGIKLRGVKSFESINGTKVLVSITATALPGSDSRLIAQLKPYSVDRPELNLGKPEVNIKEAVNGKVINYFFDKVLDSSSPEGIALNQVKETLSAITPK